ncbi:MAG: DUF547 domain-containing protein [Planctomycetota bacterium]
MKRFTNVSFRRLTSVAVVILLIASASAWWLLGRGIRHTIDTTTPLATYDDAGYATLLNACVDPATGYVNYDALNDDNAELLAQYLDAIARFGPRATPSLFPSRDDQLAYALNAYNAVMLYQMLRHDVPDTVPKVGFFVDAWRIDGQWMSLDDLEQDWIRPEFKAPRIHAALVCGARDCPPLRSEPFSGDMLDAQLDDQMRQFLAFDRGIRVRDGIVEVNRIFLWYEEDFDALGGLREAFLKVIPADDVRHPAIFESNRRDWTFRAYDWSSNDTN